MSKDSYFIIRSTEDGIDIDGPLTWSEVAKRITPSDDEDHTNYYGQTAGFLDKVPEIDKGYFRCFKPEDNERLLIIRGSVVVPKVVKRVTRFEEP